MNKTILLIIGVLIFCVGVAYVILGNSNDPSNTEAATVKAVPPQGWQLWEVVSASMSMNDDVSKEVSVQQDYLANWTPQDSNTLVFTSSPVDLKTRDLSKLLEYTNERLIDPLAQDVIIVNFIDRPVDFSAEEQNTEQVTISYPSLDGNQVGYKRMKAFDTHDVASLSIPKGDNDSVLMIRNVAKDLSDEEVLATFTAFNLK